jgi:excisionase family DNA binding protein
VAGLAFSEGGVPVLCVSVAKAAEMLAVSPWTVRAWIANGDLPVVKLPAVRGGDSTRRVLIAVADIEAFVKRHREVAS